MTTTKNLQKTKLPARFGDLVRLLPPQAIVDEVHYDHMLEMIDRLMALGRLSRDQALYLETLVQLVGVYESRHQAIDTAKLDGIAALKHLLAENNMNASDLARLLGVHASMGSKLLKRERALTVEHVRKLAKRFCVEPQLFLD